MQSAESGALFPLDHGRKSGSVHLGMFGAGHIDPLPSTRDCGPMAPFRASGVWRTIHAPAAELSFSRSCPGSLSDRRSEDCRLQVSLRVCSIKPFFPFGPPSPTISRQTPLRKKILLSILHRGPVPFARPSSAVARGEGRAGDGVIRRLCRVVWRQKQRRSGRCRRRRSEAAAAAKRGTILAI